MGDRRTRLVGRAQFKLRAFAAARATWEGVRKGHPDDLEASTLLATVYQRLDDLARSDLAVERVLACGSAGAYDRAEALSLRGRNAKSHWAAQWETLPAEQQRARALNSGFLEDAANAYADAFKHNLNISTPVECAGHAHHRVRAGRRLTRGLGGALRGAGRGGAAARRAAQAERGPGGGGEPRPLRAGRPRPPEARGQDRPLGRDQRSRPLLPDQQATGRVSAAYQRALAGADDSP